MHIAIFVANLSLMPKNLLFIFRKLYVFKIIPFLNPDGVAHGLYRSDTLGHNLNRVYITPRLDRHPSIYAVRKLIRYYHYGCEMLDVGGEEQLTGAGCVMDENDEPSTSIVNSNNINDNDAFMLIDKGEKILSFFCDFY